MNVLALIPARKGSQRVPGKNTRMIMGKPLIQHSIISARNASLVDRVIVTTDDPSIWDLCDHISCDYIKRPAGVSTHNASTKAVITHLLTFLSVDNQTPIYITLLQPTVPFRGPDLIDATINKILAFNHDSVTTHIKVDFYHPDRLKVIQGNQLLPYNEPESEHLSRDQLPPVYCRDGSVYTFSVQSFLQHKSILGIDQGYVINHTDYFVNIDTELDWLLAQAIANSLSK